MAREFLLHASPSDARLALDYFEGFYFRQGGPKADSAAAAFRALAQSPGSAPGPASTRS